MNGYFLSASILVFVVGLIHSVLGEALVFRQMRRGSFVPTDGGGALKESSVRILWASWHALTVFGWGMAWLLLWLARQPSPGAALPVLGNTIAASMLAAAVLVFVGTKAKHPGWAGLLGAAVLVWIGSTVT
ncbi:hypothetical protein J2T17_007293 [Paenibacillus mucilaginosus]|uniref:hypothetical protein n=1 Tax=Paenibacillus mucilaginosus TaxID=61624 RepID=UPI003D235580